MGMSRKIQIFMRWPSSTVMVGTALRKGESICSAVLLRLSPAWIVQGCGPLDPPNGL